MSITTANISKKAIFDENRDYYVDVGCAQKNHYGEHICGDVFRSKRIITEDRIIVVLSDGMGHGVKANVLATFTAAFAINFTEEHKDIEKIADIIMNTLPVCAERKISYSTFTIVDIDQNGSVKIISYTSPEIMIFRGKKPMEVDWEEIEMTSEKNEGKIIQTVEFVPEKGDRIVFCSDGVSQAGLGSEEYPFGWGMGNCEEYVIRHISNYPDVSAAHLSSSVIAQAIKRDNYRPTDDISCVSIFFRNPRKCLICTGPPFNPENDREYADIASTFEGKRIICGGTSSEIIARELGLKIRDKLGGHYEPGAPPQFEIEGFDLVTEGILTLTEIDELLKQYHSLNFAMGKSSAAMVVDVLLSSDEICFLVGTGINPTNQDPNLQMELEVRRTIVSRIAHTLDEIFLKEVKIIYL
ncbi:MAG: SpoIIE family protein phosphatase [Bacteroidales bacterium]|nr:SpoIIE family protein phosphatase [Bacteroidales bacterium]